MALQRVRAVLVEVGNAMMNPWRNATAGHLRLLPDVMSGGVDHLDSMGLAGARAEADHDRQNPFGPFWFAVPKKRVSAFQEVSCARK